MRSTIVQILNAAIVLGLLAITHPVGDAKAETTVRARFGEHPNFHRMVFDWPSPVSYKLQQDEGLVLLTFSTPAQLDLSGYDRNPPDMIRGLTHARIGGGAAVRFEVPANAGLKHAAWGDKVVIDVLMPAGGTLVWNAAPSKETQTSQISAEQPTTQATALATPAPAAVEPEAPKPVKQARKHTQLSLDVEKPTGTATVSKSTPGFSANYRPRRSDAHDSDRNRHFSFGPNLSTLGVGAEAGYLINDYVGFRMVGSYFPSEFDVEADEVRYDAELDWRSIGGVVDLYPFGGSFRLTGGLRYNSNRIEMDARPNQNVEIGGQVFTPSEVGTIRSDLEFASYAPYAGLGWESRWFNGRLGVAFDLGVYYQGSASADATATGTLANDPNFRQALERETREVEDDLNLLSWYPVVGVTATLRF